MCAPKNTQAMKNRADTPVCPYGNGNKTQEQRNVGAHRCVRPTHTSKEISGRHTGLPLRQGNMTQEHKDKQCRGAPMCAPEIHRQSAVTEEMKTKEQKDKTNVGAHRCVRPKKK